MLSRNSRCAAVNCVSSTAKRHMFPKDLNRCRIWAERAVCSDLLEKGVDILHSSYSLCADHFHKTSYLTNNRDQLSPYALPEIFPKLASTGKVNINEPDLLCRTCASKCDDLVSVFGERGVELQLEEKIHTYLPIQVTQEDLLPVNICTACIGRLDVCHTFTVQCLEAETKLREILELEPVTGEHYVNYAEEDFDCEDTKIMEVTSPLVANICEYPDELSENLQPSVKEEIEYSYSETENFDLNEGTGTCHSNNDKDSYRHEESEKEPLTSSESTGVDSSMVLTNCKMIQENPKIKVLVMNNSATSDIVTHSNTTQGLEIDQVSSSFPSSNRNAITQQQQQLTGLSFSDIGLSENHLLNHSSLLNLVILPTLIPKSNDKERKQSISKSSSVTQGAASSETLLNQKSAKKCYETSNKCYYLSNNKGSKPKYVKTSNGKLIEYSSTSMQPVVVLEKISLCFDMNNEVNTNTITPKENCVSEELALDSEAALKELQVNGSNVVKEVSNSTNNNSEMNISEKVKNLVNIYKNDKSKIIENIENIIKQNEALLLKTAAKKIEKPLPSKEVPVIKNAIKLKQQKQELKVFKCGICRNVFNARQDFLDHRVKEHPLLKCQHCKMSFHSPKQVQHHLKTHAEMIDYVCEICGLIFNSRSLKIHLLTHKPKIKCEVCGKLSDTKDKHALHVIKHGEASILCEICGKSIRYLSNLKVHQKTCLGTKRDVLYKCPHCGKEYRTRRCFKDHIRLHTKEQPYKCGLCGETFRTRVQCVIHTLKHTNARSHKCPVCGKGFNRRKHMRVHVLTHQIRYSCKVCDLKFRYVRDLKEHDQTHGEEEIITAERDGNNPDYICPVCGKILASTRSFNMHQLSHPQHKLFLCEVCGKYFSSKAALECHIRIHTGERPFKCEICGKDFRRQQTLRIHRTIHTGEKNFHCSYCDKQFWFKYILVAHERIHTGERPFNCKFCSKTFHSKVAQKEHIKTHSEERPFPCPYCSKCFKRARVLRGHMKVHTNERPFKCKICRRSFRQNGNCRKHEQIHFKLHRM